MQILQFLKMSPFFVGQLNDFGRSDNAIYTPSPYITQFLLARISTYTDFGLCTRQWENSGLVESYSTVPLTPFLHNAVFPEPKMCVTRGLGVVKNIDAYIWFHAQLEQKILNSTGSSRLMRISLLQILLLLFFKTIHKIQRMRLYGLFILLLPP